ncbi:MAG: hypothetical protein HYV26_08000, partial [Candidatus Hydrogenedentes bacterium]|nr:hypothetical protein [Candidatus Hydrogenedentota bacterium]
MQHFDNDFVDDVINRLRKLPPDAVPRWGTLRKDTLIEHLIWALRHSMGRSRQVPYFGNWFSRRVLGPLIIRGWMPMPHNIQLPAHLRYEGITLREPGDLETLHALLEEYLTLVQAD